MVRLLKLFSELQARSLWTAPSYLLNLVSSSEGVCKTPCLHTVLAGFCVGYMIFMSDNLHSMFAFLSVNEWMLVVAAPLMLLSLLRNLRALIPFSLLANVALFAGFCAVTFTDITGIAENGMAPDATVDLARPATLPLFFGLVVAGYEGIGLVLPVEGTCPCDNTLVAAIMLSVTPASTMVVQDRCSKGGATFPSCSTYLWQS